MFGKRLKELRKQHGYSMDDLINRYNKMFNGKMNKSNLSRYENGLQEPMYSTVVNLAKLFSVSIDYLSGEEESEYPHTYKAVQIPVLGQVAAGVPTEALEDVLDYVDIPEEMAKHGDYFGLRIKGHSMEPRIWDGDTVIVRRQEWVEDGSIAVVNVNGYDTTCKKVKYSDTGVTLISFNPVYEPMFFSATDEPFVILGRVMEIRSKV